MTHPTESRALRALADLVAGLRRTYWAPQQSIAEFLHELEAAIELLEETEAQEQPMSWRIA